MSWWERIRGGDDAREPGGRIRRTLRSIYEPEDCAPVPPLSIRMTNGRVAGVVDARGRFFPEPRCCDDPARCGREECWTRLGML